MGGSFQRRLLYLYSFGWNVGIKYEYIRDIGYSDCKYLIIICLSCHIFRYGPGVNGETVTETSPIADSKSSARMAGLVHAEEACLRHGGCCLRLGGLYRLERGTHTFYFSPPSASFLNVRGDGLINQIHYDDAAGACIAAIRKGHSLIGGKIFLLSDGQPMTREAICACALQYPQFQDKYSMPKFAEGGATLDGKVYDGSKSNEWLDWKPQHTFQEMMETVSR